MNVANGFRRLASLVLIATTCLPGFTPARAGDEATAAAEGQTPLRWTPHRSAATPGPIPSIAESGNNPSGTEPKPTAPATLAPVPAAVPASSQPQSPLAEGQPARRNRVAPRPVPPAVADAPAAWPSGNRNPGTSRGTVRPERGGRENVRPGTTPRGGTGGESSLFGMNFFRAPQGDQGRPMFGAEPVPQREGVRPAAAASDTLRFTPRQVGAGGQRLAMAPESNPAMMSRVPGSSMPTASMPRPRAPVRRVANQPTPAGELPPPAGADASPSVTAPSAAMPSRAGRPTPAEDFPGGDSLPGGMPMDDEGGLSFGGPDGDIGFGGMPDEMGDGQTFDPGMGDFGGDFPEDGMLYSENGMPMEMGGMEGPWTGEVHLHIPSFYDDPYACEDGEACPGCAPMWDPDGRICAYFRRFGRPYYGWRWYRDFTASAGVTSFQNATNLGLHGNYGFNEYANWAMPFWNAFGLGWQIGVRGVQADFQRTQITAANGSPLLNTNARNQVFLTTGFFTRAFEGRGLQGGVVYDYLQDNWFDTTDLAQARAELSYVWGYHEFGFWGAYNANNANGAFITGARGNSAAFDTLDLYTGFYRLQFGDANEIKIWGGASGQGDYLSGMLVRAPMSRSLALEGTFTYLIPSSSNTVPLPRGGTLTYAEQAWNVSTNLVWYPACRARRSLSSPYRPLFDVADNGSMIGTVSVNRPRKP